MEESSKKLGEDSKGYFSLIYIPSKITIVLIFSFLTGIINAQKKNFQKILEICNTIESHLDSYQIKSVQWDEVEEGAEGTAFYKIDTLKMFLIVWRGETGKKEIYYYFDNGNLILQIDKDYYYNRPIYYTKKIAKENNDSEAFDLKKTTIIEQKYFFNNEKLIFWVDNEKRIIPVKDYEKTGVRLISEMKELLEKINKHSSKS